MKKIVIEISVLDDKIASLIKKTGYENTIPSILEIVGTLKNALDCAIENELQNMKILRMNKDGI